MNTKAVPGAVLVAIFVMLSLVLAACGGGATPAPTAAPAQTAPTKAAPTQAAALTKAPAPTQAPAATTAPEPTAAPTATTAPTSTQAPTATVAPTTTPTPTKAAEQAPTGQAGFDLLMQAAKAQLAQKAWRAEMTTVDSDKTTKIVMEFMAPDSYHMVMPNQELIILKDATYMKQGNQWVKSPISMGQIISGVLNEQNIEQFVKNMDVQQLKFDGLDTVNGKPTWVYQYTTSVTLGNQTLKSQAKSWMGITDKLVYKMVTVSDSLVNPGSKSTTTILYTYDPTIKIEAPIQ